MNIRKLALLLAFLGVILAPLSTFAANSDNRYFIKNTSSIWKKSFGVRHSFDTGFSSELNGAQLRLAKMFNIEVQPVRKFYILPGENEGVEASKNPTSSITWGTSRILGNKITIDKEAGLGVKVAILDTGISRDHVDLKNRVFSCADFSSRYSVLDKKCEDGNGHGTHVAGIISADGGDNGKGIYGFAPAASLLVYKVCDNSGLCLGDDIAAGIERAIDDGANIINISVGSDSESEVVRSSIEKAVSKGILVIASAGNDGPYEGSIDFPASMDSVIAVGAIDSNDEVVDWSSRGINHKTKSEVIEEGDIELVAPGSGIESTWLAGGYATLSGTSMSAPHVAGLAARLWRVKGENQASAIRTSLEKIAEDIGSKGEDSDSGFGLPTLVQ